MRVKKNKVYTEDFKSDSINLANDIGTTKAASDLGINPAPLFQQS